MPRGVRGYSGVSLWLAGCMPEEPCTAHHHAAATARDLAQPGIAGHRSRFGLLNLEATFLSAHLPEIPPRAVMWAWITFTHKAGRPSSHHLQPPESSTVLQHQLFIYLFKTCQNTTPLQAKQWKGFSARRVFCQHAATVVLCGAVRGVTASGTVRGQGLNTWGPKAGWDNPEGLPSSEKMKRDMVWVLGQTSFYYIPSFLKRCQLICSKPECTRVYPVERWPRSHKEQWNQTSKHFFMQMHKTTYETSKSREQRNWHPSYRQTGAQLTNLRATQIWYLPSDNC